MKEQCREEKEIDTDRQRDLRVQWKASLLLKALLHWKHWAAWPELTGVNR